MIKPIGESISSVDPGFKDGKLSYKLCEHALESLAVLQIRGFVHRDIRIPNIIYTKNTNNGEDNFVLIDFEHPGVAGKKVDVELNREYKPRMKNGKYHKNDDLYQLGIVLKNLSSEQPNQFIKNLMEYKYSDASSALEKINKVWNVNDSEEKSGSILTNAVQIKKINKHVSKKKEV